MGIGVLERPIGTSVLLVGSDAQRVKERLDRQGMTVSELARRADVDRSYLSRFLTGKVQPSTRILGAIDKALDDFEHEVGDTPADRDDLIEYRVSGNFGVDVVVKGPIRDAEELERSVTRLIRQMQAKDPE